MCDSILILMTYTRRMPRRPLLPDELETIGRLAPIARKYRSVMSPLHPAAQANTDLTALCQACYEDGVRVTDLASAAGVTYRAMHNRLGL